ncbi:MAG: hypothetical protein WCK89_24995, partial [bacterium]
SLLVIGNWSLGALPLVTHDAVFTVTPGIKSLTSGDLIVGSFNVTATTGTFSIRNGYYSGSPTAGRGFIAG